MVASAGGCERNWSTYDFVTNGKRHKLLPERAEDLVYVHFNKRCLSRSRNHEEFAVWQDEDAQILPAPTTT